MTSEPARPTPEQLLAAEQIIDALDGNSRAVCEEIVATALAAQAQRDAEAVARAQHIIETAKATDDPHFFPALELAAAELEREALSIWRAGAEAMLRQDQERIAELERWLLEIAHRSHAGDQASCLAADCVDARGVVKAGA